MSDTPRTDKELNGFQNWCDEKEIYGVSEIVSADFARQLEAELNEARYIIEQLNDDDPKNRLDYDVWVWDKAEKWLERNK